MNLSHQLITRFFKTITSIRYGVLVTCLFSVGISNTVSAAPGPIEESPLFLTNRAEPNIFFMVDDSGSMDIEMMTSESVFGWGGAMSLVPAPANAFSTGVYTYLFGEDDPNLPVIVPTPDPAPPPPNSFNTVSWSGNTANTYNNRQILPTQEYFDDLTDSPDNRVLTALEQGAWRGRNYDYNSMYYNPDPEHTYRPWDGLNEDGNAYPDYTDTSVFTGTFSPTSVPIDPYYSSTGDTYDLTTIKRVRTRDTDGSNADVTLTPMTYWVWGDTNTNSQVDPTDARRLINIATASQCTGVETPLANGCLLRTRDEEVRNFTNWFVYHRKRDYVGKYAMSRVISPSDSVRMGMATINDDQQNSNIRLQPMTPPIVSPNPANSNDATTAGSNKANLLQGLFRMNSPSGTPLRQALQRAGEYYSCSGGDIPDFTSAVGTGSCGLDTSINTAIGATESAALCQQNFTVLITDGERNGDPPTFLNPLPSPPNPATIALGNADADGSVTFTGYYPAGVFTNTPTLSFAGYEPYQDGLSDTLADVAMYYYQRDLSVLDNRVPIVCGVDENPGQHMVTYTVGFGVSGNIDLTLSPEDGGIPLHPARGYATGCTATTGADFAWHDGSIDSGPERIDDLVHAAFNGRGKYLSAQDAEGFTTALGDAIRNISSRTGSASAVALNSSTLSEGSVAYFARFSSATWQGEFSAYPIVDNEIDFDAPLTDPDRWDAHTLLEAKLPENRAIVTFNRLTATPSAPTVGYGAYPFRDFSVMPERHQNDLLTLPGGGIDSSTDAADIAQARLDFLRGDHSCEENSVETCLPVTVPKNFRNREYLDATLPTPRPRFVLGDIINSSAVFVGAPVAQIPGGEPFGADGERYRDFRNGEESASGAFSNPSSGATANTRTKMLYVGSNDGMLHAFNADTGDEVWAYIPGALFQTEAAPATSPSFYFGPGLHSLTEQGYEHQYYVDLTPKVADAYVDLGSGDPDWHTVLVGGLRAGGRGYFAIDITDPDVLIDASPVPVSGVSPRETALATKIMWEFTTDDDRDLGLTYSEPQIVPIGDSGSVEWYVVFGNGYNSLNGNLDYASAPVGPDDKPYVEGSNTHSAKLFILKLEGPSGNSGKTWVEGTDYWKIDTEYPSGASLSETVRNSMATPALADSIGDSIADTAYAGDYEGNMWAFDITGTNQGQWDVYKAANTPVPLFVATDAANGAGARQPITAKPSLLRNTRVPTVFSGAGKNTPNLLVGFGTGSYISQDDLNNVDSQSFYQVWDSGPSQAPLNNGDLIDQGITTENGPIAGDVFRVIPVPPATANVPYEIGTNYGWYHELPDSGERVINEASTDGTALAYISIIPSVNPCSFGGTSWLMLVDAFSGTALSFSPYDIDNNGYINGDDVTSGGNIAAGTATGSLAFNSTSVNAPNGAGTASDIRCPPGTIKKVRFVTLSDGTVRPDPYCAAGKKGRASWREINFTQ